MKAIALEQRAEDFAPRAPDAADGYLYHVNISFLSVCLFGYVVRGS